MAQAERLLLAHGDDGAGIELGLGQLGQRLVLAAFAQGGFEFIGDIEMVDQRGLAAAGDEAELLDPGGAGLIDRILDERTVHDREHFLGHGFGGRQEPGSQTGDGQYRFA